jgi:hypothetical protein
MAMNKRKVVYIAAPSSIREQAANVIGYVASRGYDVFNWTLNPGYDDPTSSDDLRAALDDVGGVAAGVNGLIWMATVKTLSEGASFEAACAFAQGYPVVCLVPHTTSFRDVSGKIFTNFFPMVNHPFQALATLRKMDRLNPRLGLNTLASHRLVEAIKWTKFATESEMNGMGGAKIW